MLTTVPSGLWRTAMAFGVPVGVDANYWQEHYRFPEWGTAYVVGLTLLLLVLASLSLGLVSRWGEVAPRWIPLVGGRPVPRLAAMLPAGAGAAALTLLWAGAFSNLGGIATASLGRQGVAVVLGGVAVVAGGPRGDVAQAGGNGVVARRHRRTRSSNWTPG